jgi:hypothetical protein
MSFRTAECGLVRKNGNSSNVQAGNQFRYDMTNTGGKMSITLKFYSTQPDAFVQEIEKWLSTETDEDVDLQLDELHALYSHADFSFHLHWPSDIDALCQALISEGLDVPGTCFELLIKELWSDGVSVWVDLISRKFPLALANMSDDTMRRVLERWIKHLLPNYALNSIQYDHIFNNIEKALLDLRIVAQNALESNNNMLVFRVW